MAKKQINVKGVVINFFSDNDNDYISLNDLISSIKDGQDKNIIRNWFKNSSTLVFLSTWEQVHNPEFNLSAAKEILYKAVNQTYHLSAKVWIEETNAIGIKSKAGRYGGTFVHSEIAINFCYWLNPEFQVYFVKEFKRLKEKEQKDWLKEAKFFIDRAEQHNLEGYRFTQDMQKMIDDKLKDE